MKLLKNLLKEPTFVFGAGLFLIILSLALFCPFFISLDVETRVGMPYVPPSGEHWLGTNHLGQDMVSQIVFGLRASLYVGLLTGIIATIHPPIKPA
jgi:peptide/nickel transport system permease protein